MPFNIFKLSCELSSLSNKELIEWFQDKDLIPTNRACPVCGNRNLTIRFRDSSDQRGYGQFRCRRIIRRKRVEHFTSILLGTWFENIRVSLTKAILLTYCFARDYNYQQAKFETSWLDLTDEVTSENTLSDWYNYCRELCMTSLDKLYDRTGKIGGPGHVVEIDESKIGKRKYNVGRIVEGTWILGMIDIGTNENPNPEGDFRLEIIPNNTKDEPTLRELINKHVEKGTTIMTDCWSSYNFLQRDGFEHLTVNHTTNFVDPNTFAHTQTIESNWRPLKKKLLKSGIRKDLLALHMCEYLWRREQKRQGIDFFDAILLEMRDFMRENIEN